MGWAFVALTVWGVIAISFVIYVCVTWDPTDDEDGPWLITRKRWRLLTEKRRLDRLKGMEGIDASLAVRVCEQSIRMLREAIENDEGPARRKNEERQRKRQEAHAQRVLLRNGRKLAREWRGLKGSARVSGVSDLPYDLPLSHEGARVSGATELPIPANEPGHSTSAVTAGRESP